MQRHRQPGHAGPSRNRPGGCGPARARAPPGARARPTTASRPAAGRTGRRQPAVAGVIRSGTSRISTVRRQPIATRISSSRPIRSGSVDRPSHAGGRPDGPQTEEEANQPEARPREADGRQRRFPSGRNRASGAAAPRSSRPRIAGMPQRAVTAGAVATRPSAADLRTRRVGELRPRVVARVPRLASCRRALTDQELGAPPGRGRTPRR